MKTIYLVRHAKSDWANETLSDIDRPLNARGYSDAHKMSLILKEKKLIPDLIISSPAIRAISTALIFCRNLNFNPDAIRINRNLYDTRVKQYIDVITKTENQFKTIVLFGHNPIITNCANCLTTSFTHEMSTCSIAGITSKCEDWKKFADSNCELTFYDFPKNHN